MMATYTTTRATELAAQVEGANRELIDAVRGCSDVDWRKRSASEGWSVGVLAHHVAVSYGPITEMVRAIAEGRELPPTSLASQSGINARHAEEHANVGRQETLDALEQHGTAAAAMVRELSDEQLGRSAPFNGREMSAAQLVEGAVIGHPKQHLASIRSALAS